MSNRRLAFIQSPLGLDSEDRQSANEQLDIETRGATIFENPQFRHDEETSNIQLFFDLFFVANLTAFTNSHEVNSAVALSSYIGFFSLLWFTWCQVTLYDVRFSTDSVFERIAHACHFGVMVGMAVVGPQFQDPKLAPWDTLQQLSLILMASRLVLLAQYSTTLIFAWKYPKSRMPLIAVMGSLIIAAILYLGLSFAFSLETAENAYLAWYVVCVFEVAANIAIAGRWHIISFKDTHLVERMTCLTLVILGEGVIGLLKTISKVESLDFNFSPGTIGSLISAVLIIYFIYQIYFDNVQLEHFGTIRQQIWAFFHFPFHIALVLLMEGTNQFVVWRHIIEQINLQFSSYTNISEGTSPGELYSIINATINQVFIHFPPAGSSPVDTFNDVEDALNVFNTTANPNLTPEDAANAISGIVTDLLEAIFHGYGFEPPETEMDREPAESVLKAFDSTMQAYFNVFQLVFGYFFISAGLVLISISILSFLSILKTRAEESRRRYIGIVSSFVFGVGLTLLATMVLTVAAENLGDSAWTLPLLLLVLLIVLVLNHIARGEMKPNSSRQKKIWTWHLGRRRNGKGS